MPDGSFPIDIFRGIVGKLKRPTTQTSETTLPPKTNEVITPGPMSENLSRREIPIPGTAPIPQGNIRLFHFTYPKHLESIRTQGLTRKNHENSSDTGLNFAPDSTFAYSD